MDILLYVWLVSWPSLVLCYLIGKYFDWLDTQPVGHPVISYLKTVPSRISSWWESLDESVT